VAWPQRIRRPGRAGLLAWCGVAGPVVFTAAWVVSSLRQTGYSATQVQLSGLAALDARDPQIMMAGFVGLGACSVAFGTALRRVAAAGTAGPWLVITAGAAVLAAGVFRRDQLLLVGPDFAGESWHNQVHDLVSGVAYVAMIAAPLVLGRRFRRDPAWSALSRPLQVLALSTAATLALFASPALPSADPVIQRISVTLALAAEALIAARLLTLRPGSGGRGRWGRAAGVEADEGHGGAAPAASALASAAPASAGPTPATAATPSPASRDHDRPGGTT